MSGLHELQLIFFNPSQWGRMFPDIFTDGFVNTLILSASATAVALILGMALAVLMISQRSYVRFVARVYVDIFRGLPSLLTVYLIGFGLPLAGIKPFGTSAYPYAIAALGLINAAYMCELFRSGIQSVESAQLDAGRSLGFSYLTTMRVVIIPQAIRRLLPALTNQFIIVVKESALVYILGLYLNQRELFSIAQDASATSGNLSPITLAGLFYLVITVPMTYFVNWLDRRLREGKAVGTISATTQPESVLVAEDGT